MPLMTGMVLAQFWSFRSYHGHASCNTVTVTGFGMGRPTLYHHGKYYLIYKPSEQNGISYFLFVTINVMRLTENVILLIHLLLQRTSVCHAWIVYLLSTGFALEAALLQLYHDAGLVYFDISPPSRVKLRTHMRNMLANGMLYRPKNVQNDITINDL